MYAKHFGLIKLPFENVPDPVFFFDQGDHARVRSRVEESLKAGRGLSVVTGHIGSGKTTISQMIKSDLSNGIKLIWMVEPPANSTDLFLFIAQELGLKPSSTERTFVIRDIRDVLMKINSEGSKCLVIIDEAHRMSDDTINGIRLLNNLEEGPIKLIQILLLGQEELMEIIKRPDMEAFKQRIATLEILGKMNADGIRNYILHRIHVAGGQASIFADTGWGALVLAFGSGSTPRVINLLCDRSLRAAFERGKTIVDVDDVYEAAQSMGLQKEIFFYKIELKKRDKNKQAPLTGGGDSIKEPKIPAKELVPPVVKEHVSNVEHVSSRSAVSQSIRKESYESGGEQKSLKLPVLVLFLSIAAIILSISFYCERSGSHETMTCLMELMGF